MNSQILEKAGMSKGESEIYLVLLKIGEATASQVAKYTNIARPNIYDYLNKLKEKSLVSLINKNHKTYYLPMSPSRILDIMDEKKDLITNNMDALMSLYNPKKDTPIVEVFEGEEGFKILMNDIIKIGKEFVGWGGSDKVREYLPEHYIARYLDLRKKKKISGKMLYVSNDNILDSPLTKFKEIPSEFTSPSTTIVYGDKVAMMIYTSNPVIIIITSAQLAESYNNHFNLLWKKVTRL